MKASDALKKLNMTIMTCPRCTSGTCDDCQLRMVVCDALREKSDREEQRQPRPTLKEQEKACRAVASRGRYPINYYHSIVAADTLRRLEEDGPSHIVSLEVHSMHVTADWLRSLGVEALKS